MTKARTISALLASALALGAFASSASAAAPAVTIDPASSVTSNTAHFSGSVDPEGSETTCAFDYITDAGFQPKDEVAKVVVKATGGVFVILIEAPKNPEGFERTIPIAFNASPGEVQSALEGLAEIGPGGVIVTGGPGDAKGTAPYTLTYPGKNAGFFAVDGASPNYPGAVKITTTNPGGGGSDEVQALAVGATTGTFTLSFEGQTSAPIPYNASAPEVESALQALSTIGAGNVSVSGGPGDVSASAPYAVTFTGSLANTDVASLQSDAGALLVLTPPLTGPGTATTKTITQGAPVISGSLGRDEVQQLKVNANSGTFALSFEGQPSSPLPYGASAAEVQSALEALPAIGAGNIQVSGGPGTYTFTFAGALAATNVPLIQADGSALISANASGEGIPVSDGHAEGFGGGQPVDCTPNGFNSPSAVTAGVTGLEPATTYHLRLRASNADGKGEAVASTFTTEAAAPQIVSSSFSGVSESGATLEAQINPSGAATTYHFEYLTLKAFEEATPGEEFAGASKTSETNLVGADNQPHEASATITGLKADTAYRFRVVATNEKAPGGVPGPATAFKTLPATGAESCPNAAVRAQQGSQYLPECRAYEIVNPPGLDLGDVNRVPWASDDGTAVSYLSVGAADDALGAGVVSISLAQRSADGWRSVNADPFATGVVPYGTGFTIPKAFSSDLSRQLVIATLPMTSADTDGTDDLYRVDVGSGVSKWMTPDEPFVPTAIGASPDLGRVVYTGLNGIQVSDGTSTELVSKDSNGTPVFAPQPAAGQYQRGIGVGGFTGGSVSAFVERNGAHGISDDARRVYFTGSGGSGGLYVGDFTVNPSRTVPVGVSSRTGEVGTQHNVIFISATHDGSSAYVYSNKQLTDAATPGGGIYRFDLATETLTQVSPDAGPSGFDLRGSIASDDQSHVYFTSTAALAGSAVEGNMNAYVWTSGGGFRFIGKVNDTNPFLRVTPDGRYMLFSSTTSIGGAPNDGHLALYRYDYDNDEVICVSCRPDGSPSQGDADVDSQSHGEPGAALMRNRALSFDGRVLFNSTDRILGRDQTSAKDVYLYHDGTVSLLSSGREATNSYAAEISDNGIYAYFLTRAALVGADRDAEEYDLYDAHLSGGFLEPAPGPAPCAGEACRNQASSAPGAAAPTTPSFVGPGNPRPCPKGKVRRNARCVKPHKHKGQKHKRANADGRTGR